MTPSVDELLVLETSDLRAALSAIDRNAQGIVFVCDTDRRLLGVLTDGDARRALVSGARMDTPVVGAMNRAAVTCHISATADELLSKLNTRVTHIPLLDDDLRVVDYSARHRIRRLPVAAPELAGNELAYVVECVKTGWISSQGEYVREFERMLAAFCGVPHGVAVCNGTVALHLALITLGVGEGDEVIVPDLTFAATINVVLHAGAKPVLVDVDPDTWTLDIEKTAAAVTRRTAAIIPVHLYGQPCDMESLRAIADRHGLWLIEDCAEALGSTYKGGRVGSFGDAAAFSFFGNKTITTGEGGMLLFREEELAVRARRLRDHGMAPERRYWHEEVGYNYRMTNLQAAIGVAQMERVEYFTGRKRRLRDVYDRGLLGVPGIALCQQPSWSDNVCWLYSLLVADEAGMTRDELMEKLNLMGIETRPVFWPLHTMPPYKQFGDPAACPISTDISRRGFSLPSAVSLSDEDLDSVVHSIHTVIGVRRLMPSL